jgi:hypothetical protein
VFRKEVIEGFQSFSEDLQGNERWNTTPHDNDNENESESLKTKSAKCAFRDRFDTVLISFEAILNVTNWWWREKWVGLRF